MDALRPHETLVLQALLAGDHPTLSRLREQATDLVVKGRKYSIVGEYVDLAVASRHSVAEPPNIILGDLDVEVEGIQHGVTTLLYVIDGKLDFIEFATAADTWPENPVVTGIRYFREIETALGNYVLEPVSQRDPATLERALKVRASSNAG